MRESANHTHREGRAANAAAGKAERRSVVLPYRLEHLVETHVANATELPVERCFEQQATLPAFRVLVVITERVDCARSDEGGKRTLLFERLIEEIVEVRYHLGHERRVCLCHANGRRVADAYALSRCSQPRRQVRVPSGLASLERLVDGVTMLGGNRGEDVDGHGVERRLVRHHGRRVDRRKRRPRAGVTQWSPCTQQAMRECRLRDDVVDDECDRDATDAHRDVVAMDPIVLLRQHRLQRKNAERALPPLRIC
jgi:hypothetical protein